MRVARKTILIRNDQDKRLNIFLIYIYIIYIYIYIYIYMIYTVKTGYQLQEDTRSCKDVHLAVYFGYRQDVHSMHISETFISTTNW